MRLFNYTGDISEQGPLDFFHNSRYGTTVDGAASGSGARPAMAAMLVDGWPCVNSIPGSQKSGSLGYLFNSAAVTGKTAYDVGQRRQHRPVPAGQPGVSVLRLAAERRRI